MLRSSSALAAALGAAVALQAGEVRAAEGADTSAPAPRGTYQVLPPEMAHDTQVLAAGTRRIVFMNRNGGTYIPGENDSSANISSIPSSVSSVPPYPYGDAAWDAVMSCTRSMYARFNIEVTDVDPGSTPHIESVMGGRSSDLGIGPGVGGISPFTCGIIDRSIVFTFVQAFGNNPQRHCEVAAQETAHSFGLDHELLCSDPLTYLPACGPQSFQDQDASCGEDVARPCSCGGAVQNTVRTFFTLVGPGETEPPTLAVISPVPGATVNPGFQVLVDAADNYGIDRVELRIDGNFAANAGQMPYTLNAPTNVVPGPHPLEVIVYDLSGNTTSVALDITLMPDCTVDDDCEPSYVCAGGICMGDIGVGCQTAADCASSVCAADGRFGNVCTIICSDEQNICPAGFSCETGASGGSLKKCWRNEGDGGACVLGNAGGPRERRGATFLSLTIALGGLGGLGLLLALRRR